MLIFSKDLNRYGAAATAAGMRFWVGERWDLGKKGSLVDCFMERSVQPVNQAGWESRIFEG
jgi:hypothetical protein